MLPEPSLIDTPEPDEGLRHLRQALVDGLVWAMGFVVASVVRYELSRWNTELPPVELWFPVQLLVLVVAMWWATGLVRLGGVSSIRRVVVRQVRRWATTAAGLLVVLYVLHGEPLSRLFFGMWFGLSGLTLLMVHVHRAVWRMFWRSQDDGGSPVWIYAPSRAALDIARALRARPEWGYKPVGHFWEEPPEQPLPELPWRGDAEVLCRWEGASDHLVFAGAESLRSPAWDEVQDRLGARGGALRLVLQEVRGGVRSVGQVGDLPVLELGPARARDALSYVAAKRLLDVTVSLLLLLAMAPVMAVVAICVRLSGPGPVIYSQARSGRGGTPFTMYKFRSMVPTADSRRDELEVYNLMRGPTFKMRHDPRITAFGRLLRSTSLDELPQLVNVLKGDMSLVGPRPLVPEETAGLAPWERERLAVPPGLTCIWQVCGRSRVGHVAWMQQDVSYVSQRSLALDLKILALTLPAVITRRGAW